MSDSIVETVEELRREGRLHPKLRMRMRVMSAIAGLLALFTAYEIAFQDLPGWYAFGLFALSLPLGAYVFARMTTVEWDERREIVRAGRVDMLGFSVIVLYIAFELLFKRYLHDEYGGTAVATGLILAGVCGTLTGRVFGTMAAIHRLTKDHAHAKPAGGP